MEVGERIRYLREKLNMSQEELALKCGYKSKSSINKIEKDGRGLPQSKIKAIAAALNTTPSYLMGWVDEDGNESGYYLNEETARKAQEIYDDPNTRILLDARRDLAPEDLELVVAMIKKLRD